MEKNLNKKRGFIIPSLEIFVFVNDDIITGSGDVDDTKYWTGPGFTDPEDEQSQFEHFIQLFNLMEKENVTRKEIIEYCENNFKTVDQDIKVNEIVNLIKSNKDKIDLDNLKRIVEEEINK